MPQMAPIYWLYLFFFFLSILFLFMIMNYFIKPFSHMNFSYPPLPVNYKNWKL